ncbi:hypothetical protein ACFC1R_35630, partial [Kitasatospora sp. NPDC056138]
MHLAIFSADNFLALEGWQLCLRDGEAGYGIYPVRDNSELRITFGFAAEPLPAGRRDPDQQKQLVADRMSALRWETPRLLKAVRKAPDFHFDAMVRIRMDRWSRGRAVLLSDAGYCASPLSGQGTSLALVVPTCWPTPSAGRGGAPMCLVKGVGQDGGMTTWFRTYDEGEDL